MDVAIKNENIETQNGISYFKEPLRTDIFIFMRSHMDCNFVIKATNSDREVEVICYASEAKYNKQLDLKYENDKDVEIVQGMDSLEVNSID